MDSLMRFFQEFLAITDVGVTSPCLSIQAFKLNGVDPAELDLRADARILEAQR